MKQTRLGTPTVVAVFIALCLLAINLLISFVATDLEPRLKSALGGYYRGALYVAFGLAALISGWLAVRDIRAPGSGSKATTATTDVKGAVVGSVIITRATGAGAKADTRVRKDVKNSKIDTSAES